MTKTNRLSTLKDFSMTYPAKNSRAAGRPQKCRRAKLNASETATQMMLHAAASRSEILRACLGKTPRSTASASNTNAMNAVHKIGEIAKNMLLTQRHSWIASLRNRPAQLDCLFLKPVQQAPCPNKLGSQDH